MIMIGLVELKDGSIIIGNNSSKEFHEYVEDLQIDRKSGIKKQYIVCKDEVDEFIRTREIK